MKHDQPDPAEPRPEIDPDEVARLREEVAAPEGGEGADQPRRPARLVAPGRGGAARRVAALLAPLSVLATWASGQIQDTDRYLATVAPLASDPDVQAAVAARVEEVIFSYLDLDAAIDEVVPALEGRGCRPGPPPRWMRSPARSRPGIRSFVRDRIDALVASDAFEQAWVEANRTAHEELVAALTGRDRRSRRESTAATVSVNLAVLINTVKEQLVDAGFAIADRIPEVAATFTIVQSEDLGKLQKLLGFLDDLSTWLPVVGLGLLAAAVLIARDRRADGARRGPRGGRLDAAAGGDPQRHPARSTSTPSPRAAPRPPPGAVYDQLVSFIRLALRGVLVVALTVAVVAWFSADRGAGASARAGLVERASRHCGAAAPAPACRPDGSVRSSAQYRGPIRLAVVGFAAVGYLAQDHPTGGTALTFVLVTAVVLLVLEVLADPAGGGDAARRRRGRRRSALRGLPIGLAEEPADEEQQRRWSRPR